METGITKRTFLQINATIIAGLLIFLTIQSFTTDSLFDLVYSYNLSIAQDKVLADMQGNITEAKKQYENVDEKGNVNIESSTEENPGEVSFSIPLPLEILEKQELQISKLRDENYEEQIKLQAKIDIRNKLPLPLYLYSNPMYVASVLIVPFIASMLTEFASWSRNIRNEIPNLIAFGFFILGLALMLVIFGIILLVHLGS